MRTPCPALRLSSYEMLNPHRGSWGKRPYCKPPPSHCILSSWQPHHEAPDKTAKQVTVSWGGPGVRAQGQPEA